MLPKHVALARPNQLILKPGSGRHGLDVVQHPKVLTSGFALCKSKPGAIVADKSGIEALHRSLVRTQIMFVRTKIIAAVIALVSVAASLVVLGEQCAAGKCHLVLTLPYLLHFLWSWLTD